MNAKWTLAGAAVLGTVVVASSNTDRAAAPLHVQAASAASSAKSSPASPPAKSAAIMAPDDLVQGYCVDCHNDADKDSVAGLTLQKFSISSIADNAEVGEKMIRKLRAGMMPPPGNPAPDAASYSALINALETKLDAASAAKPNPGGRTFQRLNRAEYTRAISDLLGIDVIAGSWLPLDSMSANFDNIADEQMMSATLLESYLNAAGDISRMAVGDRKAPLVDRTYANSTYASQHPWDHVEGAPYGTRGGMVVKHIFPADGEYVFEPVFISGNNSRFEDLDVSIDGVRVALVRYETQPSGGADGRGGIPMPTERLVVPAGQHTIAAAFVRRTDGPYEDLIRPHDWSFAGGGSGGTSITTLPHLRDLTIRGPYKTTGVSDTVSRSKIFVCRPLSVADERECASKIVSNLGSKAYRRPLTTAETASIMKFYDGDAPTLGFEGGVRTAVEAILASPHFIFRMEKQPETVKPGQTYKIADTDIASRLSFFMWGTPPDQQLVDAATKGELSTIAGLEKQARRLLADPRSSALGTRFAGQWLRLQDIDKNHPDPNFYPNFDDQVASAMRTETTMFFNDLVKNDRSALELYKADYTFVNERLARFYGISGVSGDQFRRVQYPDNTRRGIFGQGSMLVQTSLANRTSPVLRGKWVMEVLLGTPPPPPPPNVPLLEQTGETSATGKALTTRERIEMHRKDPACASCHKFMDPIGLSLDQFDVTGKWRLHENGERLDTGGVFYDGTPINSPAELSAVLLKRPVPLVRTMAENMMAFALGRRVEYFDEPTVRAITKAAEANGYKMSTFILGVVKSDAFRMKRADAPVVASSTKTGSSK